MSEFIHLSWGVWRPGDAVDDLPGRAAALLSGCAPNTVLAGRTAAAIQQLWLPEPDSSGQLNVIVHPELARPSSHSGCRREAVRARRRILAPDEVTTWNGLPITTPARTWFDLASVLELPDLVAAGDSVLRGGVTRDELAVITNRARRCSGVIRARAALPLLDARSRSRPESVLRVGLVTRGLPMPAVNEPIHNEHGEWLAEPDLHYDDARLAIEYNGAEHADVARMRKDMTRGVDVLDGRWLSVSVGPVQVFRRMDNLARVISQLRTERLADPSSRRAPYRRSAR